MSNLTYGGYDLETAEEELEELSKKGNSDFLKLKQGPNVLRILPPPKGRRSPFFMTYQHYIDLPIYDGPIVVNCPKMMARLPCPACAKADKLKNSPRPEDQKLAKEFWPSRRIYANVIDRSDEASGPKMFAFGKTIHEALVKIRRLDPVDGDFTNPETGFDIIIDRTGEKLETSYTIQGARKSSPLGNMDWIEQQADLSQQSTLIPADEITAIFVSKQKKNPRQISGGQTTHAQLPQNVVQNIRRTAQDDIEAYNAGSYDASDDDIPF